MHFNYNPSPREESKKGMSIEKQTEENKKPVYK